SFFSRIWSAQMVRPFLRRMTSPGAERTATSTRIVMGQARTRLILAIAWRAFVGDQGTALAQADCHAGFVVHLRRRCGAVWPCNYELSIHHGCIVCAAAIGWSGSPPPVSSTGSFHRPAQPAHRSGRWHSCIYRRHLRTYHWCLLRGG